MRFAIGSKRYSLDDLDRVSLKDILLLEQQTIEFGHPLRWADVRRMSEEIEQLPDDDARERHPDTPWVTAVTIWAARRLAGDNVTFDQAVDFPLKELVFLPEPKDHQAAKNPTKPRAKTPKGSARGGSKARGGAAKKTQTSKAPSTPE